MDEERIRILKLLEEGKVTAQEAEKLLLALKGQPRVEMSRDEMRAKMRRFGLREMRRIPEMVGGAVSEAWEDGLTAAVRKQRFEFESKGRLMVRNVSGDTEIEGGDRSTVLFAREDGGLWKANEREGMIMAKVLSGDLKVKVPHSTGLNVNSVSGDLRVKNTSGKCELHTVSGDVELRRMKGTIDVATTSGDIKTRDIEGKCHIVSISGDIDLGFRAQLAGLVETRSGDVIVWVPSDASVLLEAEIVNEGDITNAVEGVHRKVDDKPHHVKLGFGKQQNHLWVRCRSGDIELRSYEAANAAKSARAGDEPTAGAVRPEPDAGQSGSEGPAPAGREEA
jgi:hypothetical protein